MSKIKAKKISISSLFIILGVGLGVLLTAQFRALPIRVTNPAAPYVSLKETRDELYRDQNELKSTIFDLQNSIDKIQNDSKNIVLSESEVASLTEKKAEAGLLKLNGQGISISLDDSSTFQNEDSIVHASDLRDLINLLWASGAEGISINDQRVVLNTAIDCIVNTILINNQRITAPYTVNAIGSKDILYSTVFNGMTGLQKRKHNYGLKFIVNKSNSLTLPAFNGSFNVQAIKKEPNV